MAGADLSYSLNHPPKNGSEYASYLYKNQSILHTFMSTPQSHPSFGATQKYDNYPGYPANMSQKANYAIHRAVGRLDSNYNDPRLKALGLNWSILASKDTIDVRVSNQRYAVGMVLEHVNPIHFNKLEDFDLAFEETMNEILDMILPRPLATPSPQPYPPGPSILPYINPNASGSRRQASRYYKSKSI
ncbi:hypothetical protein GALMADRAFT_150319 [Galerina marginata CBS 339.88]|uniref:Uncharacterized protein n=1 Tax=Galerina marginata (strain CBS 339.88) TaxID=685588 RepID=A0A067U133_GALM3|nr:hypothetical protein GALMADRAFT_150319 [Galerina marginata CBS 339.88]